jgi:hypothetical protein
VLLRGHSRQRRVGEAGGGPPAAAAVEGAVPPLLPLMLRLRLSLLVLVRQVRDESMAQDEAAVAFHVSKRGGVVP